VKEYPSKSFKDMVDVHALKLKKLDASSKKKLVSQGYKKKQLINLPTKSVKLPTIVGSA